MAVAPVLAQVGTALPQRLDRVVGGTSPRLALNSARPEPSAASATESSKGRSAGARSSTDGTRRRRAAAAPADRAASTDDGSANVQASGIDRRTIRSWKLKKVARTTAGPVAPRGAARAAK